MNSPAYLRPEAVPFFWSELDQSQQKAFRQLVSMLSEAKHSIPKRDQQSLDIGPAINVDTSRKSRMAFLSGARGTGKTSVLVSLQYAFTSRGTMHAPADVQEALSAVRDNVVWLDTLDMDPLPRTTNLFAAILARIDWKVKQLRSASDESPARGVRSLADELDVEKQDPLVKLHRLMSDVAMAWESNLEKRAEHLDPNAYALEVMKAEHARLLLNERLDKTLEHVARRLSRGSTNDLLFVLPIDDCDLNLTRCLEVLDLLRTISVPRLFFLILGGCRTSAHCIEHSIGRQLVRPGKRCCRLQVLADRRSRCRHGDGPVGRKRVAKARASRAARRTQ